MCVLEPTPPSQPSSQEAMDLLRALGGQLAAALGYSPERVFAALEMDKLSYVEELVRSVRRLVDDL